VTKYLDEYQPNSRWVNQRVQSDTHKLKFNNIQSCIAVVLVPVGGQRLVGVHLTTMSTGNTAELKTVLQELRAAVGNVPCDAYLLAAFAHHAQTNLKKELKTFARSVSLCDVPGASATSTAADVDVKVELVGGHLMAYVRNHAVNLKDERGGVKPNPNWDRQTALPGQPQNLTDRDAKPWMAVAFRPLA
jgi:hypothetical protein